jgi:hypothetical protein
VASLSPFGASRTDQLPFDVSGMRWHAYDLSALKTPKDDLL